MNKPLTNKEFREFLQEFKKASRLDTAMATVQTKETKNVFGDNSKTEKQLDNVNKNLESLLKGIEKLSGNFTKSNDKIVNKLQDISKGSDFKSLDKIKDTRPTTLKEELKSTVAGAKRFGSSIVSGVRGFGERLTNARRTPMGDLDSAGGFINRIGATAQDILGTSKDYTIEGSRFGKAYSKATGGSADVGMENFNQLAEKEKEIKAVEEKIKQYSDFGFEANQKDRDELDSLKKQYSDLDLRNKKAPIEKKGAFGFHGMTGEAFKSQEERDQYFKENPSAKPVMNDEQLDGFLTKMGFPKQDNASLQTANVESDNVESPAEIVAEASKDNLDLTKQLLDTTKESLTQLKAIREAVTATPTSETSKSTESKTQSSSQDDGPGLLDQFGNPFERGRQRGPSGRGTSQGRSAPGRGGIGSRIMQGARMGGNALRGAMAGGGATIAAGAAMVAAPFAIDAGLGAMGFGDKEVNKEQDEANWQRMSLGEKIQSGAARGIEKVGGLFGGTMANEAAASRIKKETEYLNKKSGLVEKSTASTSGKQDNQNVSLNTYGESDKRVQEKLSRYPESMRNDPSIIRDARDEVQLEMGPLAFTKVTSEKNPSRETQATIEGSKDSPVTPWGTLSDDEILKRSGQGAPTEAPKKLFSFSKAIKDFIKPKAKEGMEGDLAGSSLVSPEEMITPVSEGASNLAAVKDKEPKKAFSFSKAIKDFLRPKAKEGMEGESPDSSSIYGNWLTAPSKDATSLAKVRDTEDSQLKYGREIDEGMASTMKTVKGMYAPLAKEGKERDKFIGDFKKSDAYKNMSEEERKTFEERLSKGDLSVEGSKKVISDFEKTESDLIASKEKGDSFEGLIKAAQKNRNDPFAKELLAGIDKARTGQLDVAGTVAKLSGDNTSMRDEMSTSKTSQPIVSNNVQTSNNTNYVPIKSDPRPSSRGSALDRYSDRVAAY